jgi:hypothetical protein
LILTLICGSQARGDLCTEIEGGLAADASRRVLDAWLGGIKGASAATVAPVDDEALRHILGAERFFIVRFEGASHAPIPPAPLRLANLIWVQPNGTVKRLEDPAMLRVIFTEKIAPVRSESEARDVMKAYLRLAEEFVQDGFYKFVVAERSISVNREQDHLVATGRAEVAERGSGGVSATLIFDASGKLVDASSVAKVHPDWRNRFVRPG